MYAVFIIKQGKWEMHGEPSDSKAWADTEAGYLVNSIGCVAQVFKRAQP